jgi:uncharacterized protein (TIGR00369 family)
MKPRNPDFEAALRASFAAQAMMRTLGAELVAVSPGRVAIAAPILPAATQQHGYAHAGATFALGDSAAGYAALSLQPAGVEVLTSEMKIHLLAPGRGARLTRRCRCSPCIGITICGLTSACIASRSGRLAWPETW